MTFEEFAREHGVSVERTLYTGFTDEKSDRFSGSVRFYKYRVTLLRAGQRFETDWTVGQGIVERWAVETEQVYHKLGKLGPDALPADQIRTEIGGNRLRLSIDGFKALDAFAKRYKADVDSLLHSLALDAQSADQDFEEWARDLGYDPDSRKAEGIWRACGDVGRRLRNWLGLELYGALLECEES